ncbi:MAG: glycosyltransferase family 39 protein, partial [Myxococcota bacterium]
MTGEGRADADARVDPRRGWLLAFAASLLLYALTANRGVQWADSTHFMYRIVHGDVTGHLGLALAHPLHHWLGRLAVAIAGPEPLYITWVSSLCGALTVANVYGCVAAWLGRAGPAAFAAASLALASTFWRVSTITEVYTLSAALLAGTCWCLVLYVRDRRPVFLALGCFLNGLGGANDLQSGLTMLVLLGLTLIDLRARRLTLAQAGLAALAYLAGVMPYGALVIAEWIRSGDLIATIRSALFGTMWADAVLGGGISRRVLLVDVAYPLLNFPNLLLPAAAFGLWHARSFARDARIPGAFGAILAIQAVFALRYDVVEQYNFFVPMYVLLVIFGGAGAAAFAARHPER